MVTIVDFVKRTNADDEEYNALILQGGVEIVKSSKTDRYYATAKKTSVACTFDDATCQGLIGTQLPGSIQRVECEPYEILDRKTDEIVELTHRWVYFKEGETVEEKVIADSEVAMPV